MATPVRIPQTAAQVRRTIKRHPLVIFGLSYCPWCKKAETLLGASNPAVVLIDGQPHGSMNKTRKTLKRISKMNTFPQIFLKGRLLGGFTDTEKKLRKSRRLRQTLKHLGSDRG